MRTCSANLWGVNFGARQDEKVLKQKWIWMMLDSSCKGGQQVDDDKGGVFQ